MKPLIWLAPTTCLLALVTGCEGGTAQPGTPAVPAAQAGIHRDAFGHRWRRVGPVTYDHNLPTTFRTENARRLPPIESLTLEDATQRLRPRTEFGGVEYTMLDDDAREFAAAIQEVARTRKTWGAPGSLDRPPHVMPNGGGPVETVQQAAILNGESRFNINASAGGPPYDNHGQSVNCTCFKLINNHTCVTAAHCMHSGTQWGVPRDITFRAGSSAPLPPVPAGCYARTVPGSWNHTSHDDDYGVIALHGRLGAWCPLNTYNVGWLGWNTVPNGKSPLFVIISGYPALDRPVDWVYPTLSYEIRWDGYQPSNAPAQIHYYNDTTEGQSGTAVLNNDWSVQGIHSGYDGGGVNIGVRMTSSLFNTMAGWAGF
jgi:V8-like Glu-specific endopeptidase